MSAAASSPVQGVLDELERELARAFERSPVQARAWRLRRGGRGAFVAVLAAMLVAGGTAAATSSIFSASPPLRELAPLADQLAAGRSGGVAWRLAASGCVRGGISLQLRVGGEVAGAPCGAGVGQAPTVFYRSEGVALAYGLVPARAALVELTFGDRRVYARVIGLEPRRSRAAGQPAGAGAFVTTAPAAAGLTAMTVYDDAGGLLLACGKGRCATP